MTDVVACEARASRASGSAKAAAAGGFREGGPDPQRVLAATERDRPVHHAPADLDEVLARARVLRPEDQLLLQMSLTGRASFRELARLLNRHAGTLCRRAGKLARRLRNPLVAALIEAPLGLSEQYRAVGLAHHLHRKAQRAIAQEQDLSLADVRVILRYLPRWLESVTRRSTAGE